MNRTRTRRTPAFWGYPMPHDYPNYWVILGPKFKQDKVKVTNLKIVLKVQIWNFEPNFTSKLLKLLDMMCKYEMDPASVVEDTERAGFCPQTDRRTGGRTDSDRRTRWNHYFPASTSLSGGIKSLMQYQSRYTLRSLWHIRWSVVKWFWSQFM